MLRILLLNLWLVRGPVVWGATYYETGREDEPFKDPPRHFMDDPEPIPLDLYEKKHYNEDFKKKVPGEERLVGNMYAGRAEFPFIADIRFEEGNDYELHSTGTIVTRSRILTTCRTVLYANYYRQKVENVFGGVVQDLTLVEGLRWSMALYAEKIQIKVTICSNFLWISQAHLQYAKKLPFGVNMEFSYEGAEKKVRHITAHPRCREDALVYDFAVLLITPDIVPVPPTLNFLPVYVDTHLADIDEFDLSKHIKERRLCYVASFGRPTRNSPNPPFLDYKVKYRVYYTSWKDCSKIWSLVGHPTQEGVHGPYWCSPNAPVCEPGKGDRTFLMCFNVRAKIGSVCDHDRGSPVVCDDNVYGFVTRGAELDHCSTAIHMPFIAVKITAIKDYFAGINYNKYSMPREPTTSPRYRWRRAEQSRTSRSPSTKMSVSLFAGIIFKILIFDLALSPLPSSQWVDV